MSMATVSIDIVCPDWCTETAETHVSNLSDLDGCCDHRMDTAVVDTTGYVEPMREPLMHEAIRVSFASLGRIDGCEAASPVVFLNDAEFSLQQMDELATALRTMVDAYRSAGGVA